MWETCNRSELQQLDDAQLIELARCGNVKAVEEIIRRYKGPIMRFVYRMICDKAEAEDLTQQTFVHMYRGLNTYRPEGKLSTWLFVIARNLCLNELRRRERHPTEPLEPLMSSEDGRGDLGMEDVRIKGPVDRVLTRELLEKIQQAMDQLPELQRSALTLWVETDFSYEEIASILGCSVAALKSALHRARLTLRRVMKEYLATGQWEPSKGSEQDVKETGSENRC